MFALGAHLGVVGEIPPLRVVPDAREVGKVAARMGAARPRVAVHVSARRPAQRWPAERFAALIERLHGTTDAVSVLLWSPGAADHPQHPGDDEKAEEIKSRLGSRTPLVACRTEQLRELIGALAACDLAICADGGALHLAAALGKPVVCLFGDSPPERWRPWGVPHRVLRPASRDVADIGVEDVLRAFLELRAECAARL